MHRALVGAGDLAEITIEDAEVVAVLGGQNLVTNAEPLLVYHGHDRTEVPFGLEAGVGPGVEVWDVAAADGAHDDAAAGENGSYYREPNSAGHPKNHYVDGYDRSDGTYTEGYWRNSPNDGLGGG